MDAVAWTGARRKPSLLRDNARCVSDRNCNRQLLGKSFDRSRPVRRPMFRRRSTGDDTCHRGCFLRSRPCLAGQHVDRCGIIRGLSGKRRPVPGRAASVDHRDRDVSSAGNSDLGAADLSRTGLNGVGQTTREHNWSALRSQHAGSDRRFAFRGTFTAAGPRLSRHDRHRRCGESCRSDLGPAAGTPRQTKRVFAIYRWHDRRPRRGRCPALHLWPGSDPQAPPSEQHRDDIGD